MSAPLPVQQDECLNDPRLYAPPWARERPLPAAGQPQLINSPPVASALEASHDITATEPSQPTWAPRMPKGVGGPNLACPSNYQVRPEFGGDIAIRALRRKLTLQPDVVPEPPIPITREPGFPWSTRLGFVFLAAGIAGFAVAFMATNESQRVAPAKDDRTAIASAHDQARLVVEGGVGGANEPLPLGISLQGTSGGEFLLLAGLAAGTRLTSGAPVGSNAWRVMARDVPSALAYAPRDYVGAMNAAIDLRSPGDTLLDSQVVRLEWTAKAPEPTPPPAIPASPQLRSLEPNEIVRLVQRGQQSLRTGDVAAARLMLRRAAEAGSAEAAFGLAATFDPMVLSEIGVWGFAPNVLQARQWYQKAVELGSAEAPRRIERLREADR